MKTIQIITFLTLAFISSACTLEPVEEVILEQGLGTQEHLEVLEDKSIAIETPIEKVEVAEEFSEPSVRLDNNIPFVSQAPYEVWDELHQETCEEASMIMTVNFFNSKPIDKHIMEQGLIDLVSWQEERGYKVDLDADEVVTILGQYFGQQASVVTDISVEHIIAELDKGNLLIAPVAGRNLGNPYFTAPGPIYHMLVIRGYDKLTGEFITNDPGTKRGEAYRYSFSQLLGAVAEWDHSLTADEMTQEKIEQGRKVLILINNPT